MSTPRSTPSASTGLIPIKILITESWRGFIRDWKDTFSISIWQLAPALLLLFVTLANRVLPDELASMLAIMAALAGIVIDAWVNITLIQHALIKEGEKTVNTTISAKTSIGGYIWTKLMYSIALIGTLLPAALVILGFPLFLSLARLSELQAGLLVALVIGVVLIPTAWLGISLLFWPFVGLSTSEGMLSVFTEKKTRRWPSIKQATALLSASYDLVRGRFWATVIRLIVPGLVFGILLVASMTLVDGLIQMIAGPEKLTSLLGNGGTDNAYSYFLQSIGSTIFLPLFIIWQTKLFRSLKNVNV